MSLLTNTTRRGSTYQYRSRIPADLRERFRRAEIKRTLGTADPATARRRGLLAGLLAQRLFDEVRNDPMLEQDQIQRMLAAFYRARLDEDAADRRALGSASAFDLLPHQERQARLLERRRQAAMFDFSVVEPKAAKLLEEAGIDLPPDDPNRGKFTELLMRTELEVLERQIERDGGMLHGEPRDPILASVRHVVPAPVSMAPPATAYHPIGRQLHPLKSKITLSAYVEDVIKAKDFEKPSADGSKPAKSMALKYRAAAKILIDVAGDKPICEYTEINIIDFRDILLKTPLQYKNRGFKTVQAAIAANEKKKQKLPTMSAKTIDDGYLTCIRGIFDMAYADRAILGKIAEGVKAHVGKNRKKVHVVDEREPFTKEELNKIFAAPLYSGSESRSRWHNPGDFFDRSHRFWVPLITKNMGLRPEEIGQSALADIFKVDGYPCWEVTNILTKEELADPALSKKIKSLAAKRTVPVHPTLLALGFLDYIERMRVAGEIRVFPEWPRMADDTYSALISDEFNDPKRFLDRLGLKTKTKVFYSIRHNFRDELRNSALSQLDQLYLMGHAEGGTKYGSRNLPKAVINRFIGSVWRDEIDLSHIMDAPGVPAFREDRIPAHLLERIRTARRRCDALLAEADSDF